MKDPTDVSRGKPRSSWPLVVVLGGLLISLLAAMGMPNLLRSRIAANESSAVGSLRTISTAAATYKEQNPGEGFPESLSDLGPLVDANLASGQKSGYTFRYEPEPRDLDGSVNGFRVEATPVIAGQSGTRHFSSNESGVITYRNNPSERERPLDGSAPQPEPRPNAQRRRVMRKGTLTLIVSDPESAAEKVRAVAQRFGGYVDSVRISDQGAGADRASVTLRVPSDRFDDARRELRMLAEKVTAEQDDARDVTGQHVDLRSNLRNYRAEEARYLEIMRRSGSIKDTLAVAERLADVRGRIERAQGQLDLMNQQVEMAALEVSLGTEYVAQPVDVRWHPKAEVKNAFWNAMDDLSAYANFMIAVAFRLPVFILWTATVLVLGSFGWRVFRWAWKRVMPAPLPAVSVS